MLGGSFLDAKDRAILYHLDKDARQSNSSIARKTRLSKEVVNYRIKNLVKKGVIQNFYTIIDSSKLEYTVYRVFVKFENVDLEKETEIIDFLKNSKSVSRVVLLEEGYDLAIFIWAKDIFQFREVFEKITNEYGVFFRKRLITIVTQVNHFINNHLFDTSDLTARATGGNFEKVFLDEIDVNILRILTKDARTPLLDISKMIKVSPNTIKERIKRMVKNKIIVGFNLKVNADILGYQHYKIFLRLNNISRTKQLGLREYLKLSGNVICLTEAIGRSDLEFEIQVKNSTELHDYLKKLRGQFGDMIKNYVTTLVNKEYVTNCFL